MTPRISRTRHTSRRSSSISTHTPAERGKTTWSPGLTGILKSGSSGGPPPAARTMPSFGGTSLVPSGTSRPERRMRSGSSSLMTTWSKSGRRTSGTGEPLYELRALARHARARDDEVEAGGVGAALGVGIDGRVDAERARVAEVAVGAQRFDDGDAVEARAGEVDDQHRGAVGVDGGGVAGQPRLVAGRAEHAEDVGAQQQVVEQGGDAGHYCWRMRRNSWRTDAGRPPIFVVYPRPVRLSRRVS